jgi:hypothetical protein
VSVWVDQGHWWVRDLNVSTKKRNIESHNMAIQREMGGWDYEKGELNYSDGSTLRIRFSCTNKTKNIASL